MPSYIYKPLFEVSILHDYFLMKGETSFFDLSELEKVERLTKLTERLQLDLGKELVIQPSDDALEIMKQYRMVFRPTKLGYSVYQQVEKIVSTNSTVLFKPKFGIPAGKKLCFQIILLNPLFKNFTSIRIDQDMPAIFYFSNSTAESTKSSPAISLPVADFSSQVHYEMGELANFGGIVRQSIINTGDPDPGFWRDLAGNAFVNEADRRLLPAQFTYKVPEIPGISEIEAELIDSTSSSIQTLIFENIQAGQHLNLDFKANASDQIIDNGKFQLNIKSNLGTTLEKQIIINENLYDSSYLGVVDIDFSEQDNNFRLYDQNGFIIKRINPDGTQISHRTYELRFLSRLTFWRYKSETPYTQTTIDQTINHLAVIEPERKILISKKPKPLSRTFSKFSEPLPAQIFPNPFSTPLRIENDGKLYSDIYINDINNLIQN